MSDSTIAIILFLILLGMGHVAVRAIVIVVLLVVLLAWSAFR